MLKRGKGICWGLIVAFMLSLGLSATFGMESQAANTTEVEDNNCKDNATEFVIGTNISGRISTEDDDDWYKFTLSEPGTISMVFSHEDCENKNAYYGDHSGWIIRLHDFSPLGNLEIDALTCEGGPQEQIETHSHNLAARTYYIEVIPLHRHYIDAEYGIKINFTAAGDNDEKEENHTSTIANEINVNEEYNGRTSFSKDNDFYTFRLKKPGTVSIEFSHEDCLDNNGDEDEWVYPDWRIVLVGYVTGEAYGDRYCLLECEGGPQELLKSDSYNLSGGQRYYIAVYHSGKYVHGNPNLIPVCNPAKYKIKVNYTEAGNNDEKEDNNYFYQSSKIYVNEKYSARLSLKKDVDWYVFTLSEPGALSMVFSHEDCDNKGGDNPDWVTTLYKRNSSDWKTILSDTEWTQYFELGWDGGSKKESETGVYDVTEGMYLLKVETSGDTAFNNAEYGIKIKFGPNGIFDSSTNGLSDKYVPDGYEDNSGSDMVIDGKDLSWNESNGKYYWYENGVKQGTYYDPKGVIGDGTNRGREIFDPVSNAWFWLDSLYDGAKAIGKEVWVPYIYQGEENWTVEKMRSMSYGSDSGMADCVYDALINKRGKWVRYDENGAMLKGWVTISGTLAELYPKQVGNTYYYDSITGLMAKGDVTIDGVSHHFNVITGVLEY